MSFIYVSYLLSVPRPRAHDKSKVGGKCPSVPHGVGAYGYSGGSRIFLEKGDFGNPGERSERELRGSGLTGE